MFTIMRKYFSFWGNISYCSILEYIHKQELMNQWTPSYCCNFLPKIIKEKHIFEQDEGGLSQIIYLTPLWIIFIPSVTFEPLCTLNFMQNIIKYDFTFRPFGKIIETVHFSPFFEQTTFFGKNRALSLLSIYGTLTSYKKNQKN